VPSTNKFYIHFILQHYKLKKKNISENIENQQEMSDVKKLQMAKKNYKLD